MGLMWNGVFFVSMMRKVSGFGPVERASPSIFLEL